MIFTELYSRYNWDDIKERIYSKKAIHDPLTKIEIGNINMTFDNTDYQILLQKNRTDFENIFLLTLLASAFLIIFMKKEFKE